MDTEQIQNDARADFDLVERLVGGGRRKKKVIVHTDAEAGAKLGFAEDGAYSRQRRGLAGELDALRTDIQQRLSFLADDDEEGAKALNAELTEKTTALVNQIAALAERMKETDLVFMLQTIPKVIVRSVRRKAKQALGIKGKNIPEDLEEDFAAEYACQFLVASTLEWTDNSTGETTQGLTIEKARALEGYLPEGQFDVLDRALADLSLERSLAQEATDNVDF